MREEEVIEVLRSGRATSSKPSQTTSGERSRDTGSDWAERKYTGGLDSTDRETWRTKWTENWARGLGIPINKCPDSEDSVPNGAPICARKLAAQILRDGEQVSRELARQKRRLEGAITDMLEDFNSGGEYRVNQLVDLGAASHICQILCDSLEGRGGITRNILDARTEIANAIASKTTTWWEVGHLVQHYLPGSGRNFSLAAAKLWAGKQMPQDLEESLQYEPKQLKALELIQKYYQAGHDGYVPLQNPQSIIEGMPTVFRDDLEAEEEISRQERHVAIADHLEILWKREAMALGRGDDVDKARDNTPWTTISIWLTNVHRRQKANRAQWETRRE